METYKVVIGIGIVGLILGAIAIVRIPIYYDDWARTVIGFCIRFAILGAGVAIYKKGVSMRDETRIGR